MLLTMMASTSSNVSNVSDRCSWYIEAGYYATILHHDAQNAFQLICGLPLQLVLMIAFYRQSKKEGGGAYWYQLQLASSEFVVILTRGVLFIFMFSLSGSYHGRGAEWFVSNRACMWFTAHLAMPIPNMFVTTSLLLTIATSADRVFAMGKPFVYKNIDHRKHRIVAGLICLAIGVSTSLYDIFRQEAVWENDRYTIKQRDAFVALPLAVGLSFLRDAVRGSSTLILIVCNAAVIVYFRRYLSKVEQMTSANSCEYRRRREREKVLTLLAVSESISNTISISAFILSYAFIYAYPGFVECEAVLFGPVQDMISDLCVTGNCLAAFVMSRSFRRMVYDSIPYVGRRGRRRSTVTENREGDNREASNHRLSRG